MATEVLRAQDCIREAPATFNHRKTYYKNAVQKVNRKPVRPVKPEPKKSGPDPKKQVGFGLQDMYAGSAFSMSPAPSSLPLPSFCVKPVGELAATRDLRRLLRLD